MAQHARSPRDELYLKSTSFEVYIITGLVFLFGFTASFILSVISHREVLLWPGALVSVIVAAIVLRVLARREYHAKLRELEAEEAQRMSSQT